MGVKRVHRVVSLLPPFDSDEPLVTLAACLNQAGRRQQERAGSPVAPARGDADRAWELAERLVEDLWKAESGLRDDGEGYHPPKGYERIKRARLEQVARDFTTESAAEKAPVRLALRYRKDGFEPRIEPLGIKAHVLAFLWEHVLVRGRWRKVRRCDRCHDWFADLGRPQRQRFCSTRCHNIHHGRERRAKVRRATSRAKLRLVGRRAG